MSLYTENLRKVAIEQYSTYHPYQENDPVLTKQIAIYWTSVQTTFPGTGTPWSGVFVSWCIKTAGATSKEFKFSSNHSVFTHWAAINARDNTGLFRAYPFDQKVPEIGDILHNNQPKGTFTFKDVLNLKTGESFSSHSAIVVEKGIDAKGKPYIKTVGGNETQSVREKTVLLDSHGIIIKRDKQPFISLIKNLK
jgi:hypothetical protein